MGLVKGSDVGKNRSASHSGEEWAMGDSTTPLSPTALKLGQLLCRTGFIFCNIIQKNSRNSAE